MSKKTTEHLICGLVILLVLFAVLLIMRSKQDKHLLVLDVAEEEAWEEDPVDVEALHLDALPPSPPSSFLPQDEVPDGANAGDASSGDASSGDANAGDTSLGNAPQEGDLQRVQGVVLDLYDQRPTDGNIGVRVKLADGGVVRVDTETSGFGMPVIRGDADTVAVGDRVEIYGETVSAPPFGGVSRMITIFGDGFYLKKINE